MLMTNCYIIFNKSLKVSIVSKKPARALVRARASWLITIIRLEIFFQRWFSSRLSQWLYCV